MEPITCVKHGGPWGTDETCVHCTFADGTPYPLPTTDEDETRALAERIPKGLRHERLQASIDSYGFEHDWDRYPEGPIRPEHRPYV